MLPDLPKSWLPRPKNTALKRKHGYRLAVESLEDRTLFNASIVVGRTLSAYFVDSVQNNQETITYTVYNQQSNPLTGVLLTDTLASGITITNPSLQPTQSGQNLAWSLGTIQGFDRASVSLTLNLPAVTPTQLDTGAQAFATLDAAAVSAATPAATLTPGSLSDPTLLASTPDANTADPYVQEEAAALSYDPTQIFNFLHTQIGYNSYSGSLRGARGTLWSSAGNSLDKANLLVALLRSSGVPAQYEQGTLSTSFSQQLILSMFPQPQSIAGYVSTGTILGDPADDSQLLAEAANHYWVEFDAGNGTGFQAADPDFPSATIGQTFATPSASFTTIPDGLHTKVEIQLVAETTNNANTAFGLSGQSDATVLDYTFNSVDLVGKSVTVGNFVSGQGVDVFAASQTTYTYTPYLRISDGTNPDADQIIDGTSYQEQFASLPFSNSILTGLFLNITLTTPQANGSVTTQTIEKTLLDRIGIVARQTGSSSLNLAGAGSQPAVSQFDITTLSFSPSPQPGAVFEQDIQTLNILQSEAATAAQTASSATGAQTTGAEETNNRLALDIAVEAAAVTGMSYLTQSATVDSDLASKSFLMTYDDSTRDCCRDVRPERHFHIRIFDTDDIY